MKVGGLLNCLWTTQYIHIDITNTAASATGLRTSKTVWQTSKVPTYPRSSMPIHQLLLK